MENMTHTCERTLPADHQTRLQLIYSKLVSWRRNYKTRRHLRELPEHLWDDIGLDEKEINSEVRKPFWRE
ncbi:DUF1127 domain-containing protein [Vibrio diabolicus]|uniref:DUF1127 domain-containing protein n=1 Tax=Vibrio diabolicus TaxID=50719 RepID=UPI001243B130|nr:DUF1127 domain-containing protein [Vibrio diabolicus]KAB0317828.1 DUF1127 domain-containing protein [Vibrio diabolicus]MCG9618615.1 DUF1127 domain-containing protein [Vibrio diabolicus]MCS0379976.1 DUF1127 domain-containing protein [Vibrio diabolicus]MCS0421284.1 DUF1127 domain-containing protein [Vibrio diabolicus]MDV5043198.1 DUF1127 domain-containing protein [Vibrio diabolicus]